MFFPIVILVLLSSPLTVHTTHVGGPLEGFATLKECMAYAEAMAPRALMQELRKDEDAKWAIHSVGCANNRALES